MVGGIPTGLTTAVMTWVCVLVSCWCRAGPCTLFPNWLAGTSRNLRPMQALTRECRHGRLTDRQAVRDPQRDRAAVR